MKSKNLMIIILVISILGFGTGFYLKFVNKYLGPNVEVKNLDNTIRQPSLSEAIAFLEKMEEFKEKNNLNDSIDNQNRLALKRLKTINFISISGMILTMVCGIWAIRRLKT